MKSGIYQIVLSVNGARYIGSSVDIFGRFRAHRSLLRRGNHVNPHLQRSWTKHGEDKFEFSVIEYCDVSVIRIREKEIIDRVFPEFNCKGIDPNTSLNSHSAETRSKISESNIGKHTGPRGPHTPETVAKISASHVGNKYGVGNKNNLGHKASDETRRKISEGLSGRKLSPETRSRMAESARNRKK